MNIQELGKRLAICRKYARVTFRDLEKELDVGNSTLCRIEQGKPVDYDTGKKVEEWISRFDDVQFCEKCGGSGTEKPTGEKSGVV